MFPAGRASVARPFVCILAAVFLTASITSGVCLCRTAAGSGQNGTCILSLDVCGAGAVSFAAPGFVTTAVSPAPADYYYPSSTLIPPSPGTSVASAETGDIEKPPQA